MTRLLIPTILYACKAKRCQWCQCTQVRVLGTYCTIVIHGKPVLTSVSWFPWFRQLCHGAPDDCWISPGAQSSSYDSRLPDTSWKCSLLGLEQYESHSQTSLYLDTNTRCNISCKEWGAATATEQIPTQKCNACVAQEHQVQTFYNMGSIVRAPAYNSGKWKRIIKWKRKLFPRLGIRENRIFQKHT